MASTYLTRTQSAGNRKTFTISTWVKRNSLTTNQAILSCYTGVNDDTGWIEFRFQGNGDSIHLSGYDTNFFRTNRACRDTNGWMHIVVAVDTTQATASNRIKLYVNGVQETSFAAQTQPSQNADLPFNANNIALNVGKHPTNSSNYFDGSMSHFHFIDGTAYDASAFGETDTTTSEWKAKTSPSVTYGNNGFFILKDGNGITDQSGEGNDFTLGGGTLIDLKDNPDNVFATLNGAFNLSDNVLSNGNTKALNANANWKYVPATLGASSGKFYAEYKATLNSGSLLVGVVDMKYAVSQDQNSYTHCGAGTGGVGYYHGDGQKYIQDANSNYGNSYTTNDIIGVALDMDNSKVYFSKNGTWQNSGDPTSGATGTGAISLPTTGTYTFAVSQKSGSYTETNFGNGYFGTTAVSSAGTNASDNGIFEYDVPTGYTALSTKGLNL